MDDTMNDEAVAWALQQQLEEEVRVCVSVSVPCVWG
jgi:hypothetical protein